MPRQFGYTFVELLVVVALIGVLASVTVFRSPSAVNARSVLTEAEVLASRISYLITKARASQSTIKFSCTTQTISTSTFVGVRSNTLSVSGGSVVGLDANIQTNALTPQDQNIFDGGNKTTVQCPTPCGDLYITSDGYLLTSLSCNSIDFIFSKGINTDTFAKLSLSNLGYPRLYMKSTAISNNWSEQIR